MKLREWLSLNRMIFLEGDLRFLMKTVFSNNFYHIVEDVILDKNKLSYLEEIKRLYVKGVPLPYIIGKEEFFGFKFKVNRDVLIPRRETELIVERAIELIKKESLGRVLDLGSGSGNIGVVIKKILKEEVNVFSSDINLDALAIAKVNAESHSVDIKFINADLLTGFKDNCFDVIISNPPYVASAEIKGSLSYEPRIALEGGEDGLRFIKEILCQARRYLTEGGYAIIEIGYNQKLRAERLALSNGYEVVDWIKDYSGYYRGIVLKGTD